MLEKIEAQLATAGPTETRRLRQRAELIRELSRRGGDHLSGCDLKRVRRLGRRLSQCQYDWPAQTVLLRSGRSGGYGDAGSLGRVRPPSRPLGLSG